jgi:alpha-glucosidase
VVDDYGGDRFTVGEIHVFDRGPAGESRARLPVPVIDSHRLWERWADYYGAGDELHMPFNFSLLYAPWDAAVFRRFIDDMELIVPEHGWPNVVLGNHDELRLADRYGHEHTRVAAMMLLTLRGTATMYYGDEIGMTESSIPPDLQQDPWIRPGGTNRDGCRTPMQWDDSANAGFSPADATPWLPVGADVATINVTSQLGDPNSLLNLYGELLALRRRSPALHRGDYRALPAPDSVFAYARRHEAEELIIALNFGDQAQVLDVPAGSRLELATAPRAATLERGALHLGGNAGAIAVVA